MRVSDERARAFYAEECAKSAWSVRQLERQINTMYYQWIRNRTRRPSLRRFSARTQT
ncbi:MAG: DUF1016 N-terminal domain-containing protein [Dysosmobacter welbionis]